MNNYKIKILHVINNLNDQDGGLYDIVKNSCNFLNNFDNVVITSKIKNKKILKKFRSKVILLDKTRKIKKIFFSLKPNLIHVHGIWSLLNTIICFYGIFKKIPLIISPQGMLEPWSLKQKLLKKKLFFLLFWKKNSSKSRTDYFCL